MGRNEAATDKTAATVCRLAFSAPVIFGGGYLVIVPRNLFEWQLAATMFAAGFAAAALFWWLIKRVSTM